MQFSIITILALAGLSASLAVPAIPAVALPTEVLSDLPITNSLPDIKEKEIEKRCSAWNKVFNPCSCPSQKEACDKMLLRGSCMNSISDSVNE